LATVKGDRHMTMNDTAKNPEVREIALEAPEPITESKLKSWSKGFTLPTIVRNAFEPPELSAEGYLPRETKLFANLGALGGFNHTGNGVYSWGELWDAMEESKKVYGSFGAATNNRLEEALASVLELKRRFLPPTVFPLNTFVGHIIFGSTDEVATSTEWHNGISANLVFQLAGRKLWWSTETLQGENMPLSLQAYTNGVTTRELFYSERRLPFGEGRGEDLYEAIPNVVLGAGDMLINPPFSWHAIKIDERNITLSVRGDRYDALVWIAYRYFDGNFDHPIFVTLCNFFWSHEYQEKEPLIDPATGRSTPDTPNAYQRKFLTLAGQYRTHRKILNEYRMRYESSSSAGSI